MKHQRDKFSWHCYRKPLGWFKSMEARGHHEESHARRGIKIIQAEWISTHSDPVPNVPVTVVNTCHFCSSEVCPGFSVTHSWTSPKGYMYLLSPSFGPSQICRFSKYHPNSFTKNLFALALNLSSSTAQALLVRTLPLKSIHPRYPVHCICNSSQTNQELSTLCCKAVLEIVVDF